MWQRLNGFFCFIIFWNAPKWKDKADCVMGLLDSFGSPGQSPLSPTLDSSKTPPQLPPFSSEDSSSIMHPRNGKFARSPDPAAPLTANDKAPENAQAAAAAPQMRPQIASFPIIGMVRPRRKPRATDHDSLPAIETCNRSGADVFDSKIMVWPVVIVAAQRKQLSSTNFSNEIAAEKPDDSGFIGIEFQPRFDRHFIITEIAKNGPSDLNEGIMVGDILLAVNGVPIRNLVRA